MQHAIASATAITICTLAMSRDAAAPHRRRERAMGSKE